MGMLQKAKILGTATLSIAVSNEQERTKRETQPVYQYPVTHSMATPYLTTQSAQDAAEPTPHVQHTPHPPAQNNKNSECYKLQEWDKTGKNKSCNHSIICLMILYCLLINLFINSSLFIY